MHNRNCLLLLLISLLAFSSCKKDKDEEVVDIRDEIVGTYTYLSGGLGTGVQHQIEISKDLRKTDRIHVVFTSLNYSFYAQNIVREAEGVGFEIPRQLTSLSGLPFITEGQPLGKGGQTAADAQTPHQAFFFRSHKELHMELKATILNTSFEEQGSFGGTIIARRNP